MEFCSIASGSSGNCIYVGDGTTHLIVDAGISGKRIEAGLNRIGLKGSELDGILVTHEHSDHIQGLGVMARRYGLPIYATEGTLAAIRRISGLGAIPPELFTAISEDVEFSLGDMRVRPIRISHDAAQPVAYRLTSGKKSAAVMTDLGYFDDYIVRSLEGLDILLLEANHDIRMLEAGPYPYPLKQRILGKKGHLSNDSAGRLLCRVLNNNIRKVFLGHLSKENNYAQLAYETVRLEVDLDDCEFRASDFDISIAQRNEPTEVVCA